MATILHWCTARSECRIFQIGVGYQHKTVVRQRTVEQPSGAEQRVVDMSVAAATGSKGKRHRRQEKKNGHQSDSDSSSDDSDDGRGRRKKKKSSKSSSSNRKSKKRKKHSDKGREHAAKKEKKVRQQCSNPITIRSQGTCHHPFLAA